MPDGKGTNGRFEIVIVMPEHRKGLLFFQDKAERLVDENFGGDNIIDLALEALQSKRNDPVDYIVNMPEFKIDSNIEATEMFRKVNISRYLFEIICFQLEFVSISQVINDMTY